MPETSGAVNSSAVELKKICPQCQTENNVRNRICRKCRYRFEGEPPANGQVTEFPPVPDLPSQSTITRFRSPGLAVDLTPVASVRERFQVSRSLRELRLLYVEVAVARVEQRAYARAVDALQQALEINDISIQNSDILFYLAYVCELMNDMSQALHTYLEALVEAPAFIEEVLPYVHTLLTADVALEQSDWVLNEWEKKITGVCPDPVARMHTALLIAHLYLLLDRYGKAKKYLSDAHQQAPDAVSTMTPYLFGPDVLPASLAAASTDSTASLTLAQLYQALGDMRLAMEEIDHTLALADAGSKDANLLAEAYLCKAELLEQLDNKKEAAQYFFKAAMQYGEQNNSKSAIDALRHANRLDDQDIQTYWYLSEALRMYSYSNDDATFVEPLIIESRDVWQQGYKLKHPGADDAWAYNLRAAMNMQFMRLRLPTYNPWALAWEALAYTERSALNDRTASTDTYLGSFSRMLRLTRSALSLTEKAIKAEPGNPFVIVERINAVDEVEDYEEAEALANKLYDQERSADNLLVKAFILLRQRRFEEALQLIEPMLAPDAPQLATATLFRAHALRAYCLQRTGNVTRALESSRWIMDHYRRDNLTDRENWGYFAWAAFDVGGADNIVFARELAEQQTDRPGEDPGGSLFISGMCLLVQGDVEQAEAKIRKALEASTTILQLDGALDSILNFERCSHDIAQRPQVRDVLERAKKFIDELKARFTSAPTPEDELKAALKTAQETEDKSNGWAEIAALAGLGRLYTESARWQEAFDAYRMLADKAGEERFPEAQTQREKAIDHIFDALDEAIRTLQVDRILELNTYLQSLFVSPGGNTTSAYLANDRKRLARFFCQVGYIQLLADSEVTQRYLSSTEQSRSELRQAMIENGTAPNYIAAGLVQFVQSGSPDDFARACQPLFSDPTGYWYLDALLEEMGKVEESNQEMGNVITQARKALMSYVDQTFKLSAAAPANVIPDPPVPMASLFLEPGLDLIPPDLDQEKVFQDWNMIKTYIPNLRQKLRGEFGLVLPGVKVQDNRWISKTAYKIRHYDTVLTEGETLPGMAYTPVSLETLKQLDVPEEKVVAATHPLTGVTGYWVPEEFWEMLKQHNEELWTDPMLFITYALEASVRSNAGRILELQAVQWLLDSWEKDESLKNEIKKLLSDATTRFYFARLLRALGEEQVSLAVPLAILDALHGLDLAQGSIGELIRTMRLRLKPQLPGNRPDARHLALPATWEDKLLACLKEQDGLLTFVVPPEEFVALSRWLREQLQLAPTGWNQALVVRDAVLRPLLWQLLHASFPLLSVLSQEESLDLAELHEAQQAGSSG